MATGGLERDGAPAETEPVDTFLKMLAAPPGADADGIETLLPGIRLGRYEILRPLGQGAFGAVYEARDTELGRHVAIKILRRRRDAEERLLALFKAEAELVARLNHPNIVTLHDFGTRSGAPYLVLELLRGETLAARLARGHLGAHEAVEVMIQLARGLGHAHQAGVIHRDLKPSNVFLRSDGQVKILDFGLARLHGEPEGRAGTAAYMAPEQRRGDPQDARTDLFSLGVLLYEMLSGRLPFASDTAPPLGEDVPGVLSAIVSRSLVPHPAGRFQSAEELALALVTAERSLFEPEGILEAPYRYLEQFTEADAPWFFGRSVEAARLEQLLTVRPLAAVVGPSGAGKSSLVQAGLIPRLRRQDRPWAVLLVRPGHHPFERLHGRLVDLVGTDAAVPPPAALAEKPGAVGEILRAHARHRGGSLLLIVDQLEELVTQVANDQERTAFAAALAAAADDAADPTRVLLCARDDFVARLARLPPLGEALGVSTLLLAPPDAAALEEALRRPAARLGFELEEGVCEEMVRALQAHAAPLPLLQLAASRLWEHRDEAKRLLLRAALEEVGGVGGVLAAHADGVLHRLTGPRQRDLVRRVLCELTTPEGTRRQLAHRELRDLLGDPPELAPVVEHLVAGRIVTASHAGEEATLELSHELLTHEWHVLRGWLEEGRHARHQRERVAQAAALWAERGRPPDLLWAGNILKDAITATRELPLAPTEGEYLRTAQARWMRRQRLRSARRMGAIVATGLIVLGLVAGIHVYRQAADAARRRAIVQAAAGAKDPLVGALLLRELAPGPAPPEAHGIALRIARSPLPLAVLRGHTELIQHAAFSPDGMRVATASFDKSCRIWPADGIGDPIVLRHRREVKHVAFTRDGQRLVTIANDGVVRIWPADGSGRPTELRGHRWGGELVVLGPRGSRILSGAHDNEARIFSLDSAGEPIVLRGHTGPVWSAAFSPNGELVATASGDGTARVWRSDGKGDAVVLRPRGGILHTLRFSPDGTRILLGAADGVASIWTVDGQGTPVRLRGHEGVVWSVDWSPDGQRVATASDDRTVRVWRADGTGPPSILRGHRGPVRTVLFSRDGSSLLTASSDGSARLWRADGSRAPIVLGLHAQGLNGALFSPDGSRALTFGEDGSARVFDLDAAEHDWTPTVIQTKAMNVAFSPDGSHLASAGEDGLVHLWRSDGAGEVRVLAGHHGVVSAVLFSRDGSRLLTSSHDGTARVWPFAGGAPRVLRGHKAPLPRGAIAESPDGSHVLTWSEDGTARVWPQDGSEPRLLGPHRGAVFHGEFSADGRRVLTASLDGTARVWRSDAPPYIARVEGWVTGALSPDGSRLVTGGDDPRVRLWPLDRKEETPRILGEHGAMIYRVAFSPDGSRVASASADRTARIWDTAGASPPLVLRHSAAVWRLLFTPDGSRLLTAGNDGWVRVFRVSDGNELFAFGGGDGPIVQVVLSPNARHVATVALTAAVRLWRLHEWPEVVSRFTRQTTACLTVVERIRLLAESEPTARRAHESCERGHGRTPQLE
jgi:WD40 repeat protein/tRNA A-37 threonylcarbamoyl transferase component Bud32